MAVYDRRKEGVIESISGKDDVKMWASFELFTLRRKLTETGTPTSNYHVLCTDAKREKKQENNSLLYFQIEKELCEFPVITAI